MRRLLAIAILSAPALCCAGDPGIAHGAGNGSGGVAQLQPTIAMAAGDASPPAKAVRRVQSAPAAADEEASPPESSAAPAPSPAPAKARITRPASGAAPATVGVRPGTGTTVRQPRPSGPATVHSTAVVMSPARCEQVRTTGNTHRDRILSRLDIALAGTEHPIDANSTLLLQRVQDIEFRGCDVRVSARVAILRQGRPDAVGDARLLGRVDHFDPAQSELCFEQRPELETVNVGGSRGVNDIRMGAALQRVHPVSRCIDWR